jgi:phthiodiolone/phenolphthiodiolone dimycocerosates ketoreductase
VQTSRVDIATCVVDTVRRHPALLAQTALTIDHLAKGRFILGLGSGETENTVPYGFDFSTPVSRYEEALQVIRLLWDTHGPIDFEGRFFQLHHARMDTEPYQGRHPRIWCAANGPRMLEIAGRYADGWWPAGAWSPEEYADKLALLRRSAEKAGRDPQAIVPALIQICLIGDAAELAEIMAAPLVKALVLQFPAAALNARGFEHPMGNSWRGYQDLNPALLTRERVVDLLRKVQPESILALVPHGTPTEVAKTFKAFAEAGMRVPKIMDYSGMAGLQYGARSALKVRETEDELLRLTGATA